MLCSVLSLVMITSSLGGCAAAPVRSEVTGPEVYGYTLYQTLSGKQFQPLTGTGKPFADDLELYLQAAPDGGVFGLYVGKDRWLDTVSKTSKRYVTELECEAPASSIRIRSNRIIRWPWTLPSWRSRFRWWSRS